MTNAKRVNRLIKFVNDKSYKIRKNPKYYGDLYRAIMSHPNYDINCTMCCVIVALQVIDNKTTITFFTGSGFSPDINNSDFYFDEDCNCEMRIKEIRSKYDNIVEITTMRII